MVKQRITDQVSIQEMLNLRGQGMTNAEIADSLEISYASVLKYLGKSDVPRKNAKGRVSFPPAPINRVTIIPTVAPKKEDKPTIMMPVISKHIVSEFQGCQCVYKVDSDLDYVELMDSNGGTITGLVPYDDIPKIIKELEAVLNGKKSFTNN